MNARHHVMALIKSKYRQTPVENSHKIIKYFTSWSFDQVKYETYTPERLSIPYLYAHGMHDL